MEILVIAGVLEESLIDDKTKIKDLPNGLRKIMLENLRHLSEVKRIKLIFVDAKFSEAIIELPKRNALLSRVNGLRPEVRQGFIQALELLQWYFSPRWLSDNPGAYGAPCRCADCGATARPLEIKCKNPFCLSHENYRLVMDE